MYLARYSAIAMIGCATLSSGAQTDTTAAGEALLTRMEAAYKSVDSLHIKVKSSATYSGAGSADDFPPPGPDTLELRMQRPNKLFVSAASRRDGEQSSYLVVSDGTTLTYWRSWTNSFVQTKAPAVLTGIARQLPDDAIGTFVRSTSTWEVQDILEWDLLANDPTAPMAKELLASGGVLTTTGPEKQDGALVHVVRLTLPRGALPFTLENRYYLDAESYLVRGLGTSVRGKHPENGRDFTVEMKSQYEVFSTRPTFSDADFRFVAPRGARPEKGR